MILSLLIPVVCQSGCARTRPVVASLWQQVPPVRWPGREAASDAETPERNQEPAVAANVALKAENESATPGVVLPDAKSNPAAGLLGLRLNAPDPRNEDSSNSFEFTESTDSGSSELDRLNSPLKRLNEALSDDHQHALPQRSVTMLEERIRIDSLMTRAKELMDLGQLEQAHDAAVAAQELGESVQIEYSPDNDRPIDLVRRIEGRLDTTQVTNEGSNEHGSSAGTSPQKATDASHISTTSVDQHDKDPKAAARKQRSWSTLFRRDKKPNLPGPADPVTQSSNQLKPTPNLNPVGLTSISGVKDTDPHDAIVMANRSISLGTPDASSDSEGQLVRPNELVRSDRDPTNSPIHSSSDSQVPEYEEGRTSDLVVSTEASLAAPPSDDGTAAIPDLASEEIAPVPRRVKASSTRADRPGIQEGSDTEQQTDWTYLYLVVGIASLFGFVCYRRGMT